MASIMGRLARTLAQGGEGISGGGGSLAEGERHRRMASVVNESGGAGLLSPRGQSKLSTSSSFNDFSLLVQEDAVEEYGTFFGSTNTGDAGGFLEGCFSTASVQNKDISPAARPDAAAVAGVPRALSSRTGSLKVMGLDAYDYHDLLRSNSH